MCVCVCVHVCVCMCVCVCVHVCVSRAVGKVAGPEQNKVILCLWTSCVRLRVVQIFMLRPQSYTRPLTGYTCESANVPLDWLCAFA